ncbi:MAG TPA: hypothetical protein VFS08_07090 [Gemmatimonadaceae bacterium]|jgi:hypothetical protein|nr:hypothetical protein [Gemmatimonadaceae bacterium]
MRSRRHDPLDPRLAIARARVTRRRGGQRLAAVGFLGGLAAGVILASQQLHRHRRNLFSPRPYERLVALAALRAQPSVETLRLLHDYVGWESRPTLRRRGFQLLRQLERTFS